MQLQARSLLEKKKYYVFWSSDCKKEAGFVVTLTAGGKICFPVFLKVLIVILALTYKLKCKMQLFKDVMLFSMGEMAQHELGHIIYILDITFSC